jgi:hypothetical protein
MRTALLSLGFLLILISTAWADEPNEGKILTKPVAQVCTQQEGSEESMLLAGRGCCSWHKGQCGCEGGRVVCCDGSLSPSCRCEKDEGPVN